jgi:hypothetical protein
MALQTAGSDGALPSQDHFGFPTGVPDRSWNHSESPGSSRRKTQHSIELRNQQPGRQVRFGSNVEGAGACQA